MCLQVLLMGWKDKKQAEKNTLEIVIKRKNY